MFSLFKYFNVGDKFTKYLACVWRNIYYVPKYVFQQLHINGPRTTYL